MGGDAESITKVKENVRESMSRCGLLMREHEDVGTGMAELLGHVIKAVRGTAILEHACVSWFDDLCSRFLDIPVQLCRLTIVHLLLCGCRYEGN